MGIPITSLLPEIQTLVNSDPAKYDPNGNYEIDDGEELSTLLSEYSKKRPEQLTPEGDNHWGKEKTLQEKAMLKKDLNGGTICGWLTEGVGTMLGIIALESCPPAGLAIIAGSWAIGEISKAIGRRHAFNKIKAEQANKAEEIRQNRRAKEEELRQREEALKQEELKYRQDLDTATKNIESQVCSAQRKARAVNKELNQTLAAVDSLKTSTQAGQVMDVTN